ncbi:LacI family DNA-binding transcriptional regulator [Treponema sp. HNW]|uniref:LacI family DNA-binding transcriptional regulator n=1 Tax=Treponema sp. HNW TaxID=3116654 RepID=UPI003D106F6E
MAATLSSLAKETGFSVNTVSRVLRGDKNISAKTTQLIKKAAEEMEYIPNYIAGSMRRKETKTIGVISADSSNPFFAEIILGIEETAKKQGYHILLMNTEENPENECAALKILQARQVDGLISMPVYNDEHVMALYEKFPHPYLFAGRKVLGLEKHAILFDDARTTHDLTQRFIKKGHRRILYITGPAMVSNTFDRLYGYVYACIKHNLPINRSYIIKSGGHIKDGYKAVDKALKKGLEFTAVICFNDLVAAGVLRALNEQKIRVPEKIEVAGCDNLDIAKYLTPALSTLEVPKHRLGEKAVLELIEHIKDKDRPYKTIYLKTRMMFRESTLND